MVPSNLWLVALLLGAAHVGAQDPGDCSFSTSQAKASTTGQNVVYTLTCPDSPPFVDWDFGDGTKLDSGSISAQHFYSQAGHYLVVARAEGHNFLTTIPHTVGETPTALSPVHSAGVIYDAKRHRIFVVNPDHNTIAALNPITKQRVWEGPVGKNPRTLALDSIGRIWVACQDDATISIVDGESGKLLKTIPLPYASRPYGIAFAPGTNRGYVTLEVTGRLVQLDGATGTVVTTLDLGIMARAVAITSDGRILTGRFISPADHGEVVEISPSPFALKGTRALAMDPGPDNEANSRGVPNAVSDIVVTPDGHWAWVASKKDNVVRGRFREGVDLTFETTVRSITSQIDLNKNEENLSRRKDYNDQSLASAIAFTRTSGYAFVAHAGSNNVEAVDAWSGANVFSLEAESKEADRAPEGLALDETDSLLFVWYFLSREVGVWDISKLGIDNTQVKKVTSIATTDHEALALAVLRGKRVFYNAADVHMSKDRYNSCVVCHMDGATDGRVWDFTQRGEGLRRTTSLLGKAGTGHGPVHWSANFDEIQDFEHDIRGPFGGTGFMEDQDFNSGTHNKTLGDKKAGFSPDLDDLAAYVTSLTRVHPSPYRNADASLTTDAIAGKAIFNRPEVGCAKCHSGSNFSDSKLTPKPDSLAGGILAFPGGFLLHDVGTIKPSSGCRLTDTLPGFDTPTLKGIWEFSPYLHDGSAATLMDVITTANPADRHGKTSSLSQEEKKQLVAYLQQIDESETSSAGLLPIQRSASVNLRLSVLKGVGTDRMFFQVVGIPQQAPLFIAIHRPDGSQVRVLEDRDRNGKSERVVAWDGRDESQRKVGPGIYFLEVHAGLQKTWSHVTYWP